MPDRIEIGYQAFVSDGSEEFGAIRSVSRDGLVVYVENAGDFPVPLEAVTAVALQKGILRPQEPGLISGPAMRITRPRRRAGRSTKPRPARSRAARYGFSRTRSADP